MTGAGMAGQPGPAPAILAVDAGGGSVKYALLGADCRTRLTPPAFFAIPSFGTKEELLDVFYRLFADAAARCRAGGWQLCCAAFSVPGPFDCENGISRMRHKWPALRDVPLRGAFAGMGLLPPGLPIGFVHDVHAFLLGERLLGRLGPCPCAAAVVLGTGLGFGAWKEGRLLLSETGDPLLRIFNLPWQGGILEDQVSGRGLSSAYSRLCGRQLDARQIADAARQGDACALEAYRRMGEVLGSALRPLLQQYAISGLVFGGRISCAFELFGPAFLEASRAEQQGVLVYPSRQLEYAAMCGAAAWASGALDGRQAGSGF